MLGRISLLCQQCVLEHKAASRVMPVRLLTRWVAMGFRRLCRAVAVSQLATLSQTAPLGRRSAWHTTHRQAQRASRCCRATPVLHKGSSYTSAAT